MLRPRDRAERDNRAKDEFIAMLAHEVRNPARSDRWCCPVWSTTSSTQVVW